ncbi:MAG: GtrA family protein [Clostridia bacterium]|jgi:putative flippase GtrA|nr:GtrA family protein [Clostridia bacterium]
MESKGKKEFVRTIKFMLFSISAGIIQIGSFTLMNEVWHFPYWVSYLIALVLSVLWNFTLNRKFTFKSANNVPIAMLKVAGYYAVFTPLSTMLEHYLTMTLGWNEYLVTFINMFINLVTEFLFQRFFVFGKSIDSAVKKNEEEPEESDGNTEIIDE